MTAIASAHAVILAGGRGTRFWPLSRRLRPKQLLPLTPNGPLLAQTVARITPLIPRERQWIVTNAELIDAVAETLAGFPRDHILAEPVGRNTAPAIALAAALLEQQVGDAPFAVLPSDHLISPESAFLESLATALDVAARSDLLLTFGIAPTGPETGYGYIESGDPLPSAAPARKVLAFTEKPDLATARRYLEGGRHLWNSGMFAWRVSTVLAGLTRHQPGLVEPLKEAVLAGAPGTGTFERALNRAYGAAPAISIDYALLERADNVGVLPAEFQWNDVGHWPAMRSVWPVDAHGNAAYGRTVGIDSGDCIVYGPGRVTALVGVHDLVVVHTDDVTLVCDATRAQDVRRVIDDLERSGDETLL